MNPSYFFCGSVDVTVSLAESASLLDICMHHCIPYADFKVVPDGVQLTFRLASFKKLKHLAAERGITLSESRRRGLPLLLLRLCKRPGLILGALAAAVLVFLSGRFVREIEVTGNESVTTSEILALLEEHGFSVGSYIPTVNTDKVENALLQDSDKLSWISINILGSSAEVQVREEQEATPVLPLKKPANLVAGKAGVIETVQIYKGKSMVKSGQFVEKGDLLVSGLYDSERVGFRYTRAAGSVMAKTVTEFYIEIPYEYEGIRHTGAEYCDKYLNFFNLSIHIFKNTGNMGAMCDKIDIVENYCLPDGTVTPIELHTVRYSEYEPVTLTRSADEAEALAYFTLSEKLAAFAADAVLVKKSITPRVGEHSFSLYCTVVAVENIASVSEFEVDMSIIGE